MTQDHTEEMRQMAEAPSTTPSGPPLNLPRFTYLCYPPTMLYTAGVTDFAKVLLAQDPGMLRLDFQEPVRLAVHALFHGGYQPSIDLTDPATLKKFPPGFTQGRTYNDWLCGLEVQLRGGSLNILGHLAVHGELGESVPLDLYDRYLFVDATEPKDVEAVVTAHFPTENHLCIHLGPMGTHSHGVPNANHIWLAQQSPAERLAQLRRELEPRR